MLAFWSHLNTVSISSFGHVVKVMQQMHFKQHCLVVVVVVVVVEEVVVQNVSLD
jgi:hypothetical protein